MGEQMLPLKGFNMNKLFVPFLPPWVETGLQPAFYDKESGTVLQQTARMYDKVNQLIRNFNDLSKETKETVEEYILKFTELKDFVDDYFDNLDVQDEINNKLDEMAEAGTLQEIITAYIQSNVTWTFDTVADMKQATNLVDGSFAQTLGFHSVNDGGGALYKITNTGTADEKSIITIGDLKAHLCPQTEITPEMLGAYGDGVHDDANAIQAAINFALTNGCAVKLKAVRYIVSETINVPNGTKLLGSTVNESFQSDYKFSEIKADFANTDSTNTTPVINISNDNLYNYSNLPSGTVNVTAVQIKDININGNGAFCGIKCRGYDIDIRNVTIMSCRLGMFLYKSFTSYFTKVNIFFCEIGIYCAVQTPNTIIRDCYISYGSNILTNNTINSIVTDKFGTALKTNKICGIYGNNSKITIEDTCIECEYYGIFTYFNSIVKASNLFIESIVTGGAAISDESNDGANYVKVDNLSLYNPDTYGGSIVIVDYRSQYYISSDRTKPANFADPTMSTRGVMKVKFSDWEYILPVSLSNVTGLDVTNNYTKFNDNGDIDVDFVVNDYTSQDLNNTTKLILGNLDSSGYVNTGHIPMLGADYRINTASQAFTSNTSGTFVATPKKTRLCFKLKYAA